MNTHVYIYYRSKYACMYTYIHKQICRENQLIATFMPFLYLPYTFIYMYMYVYIYTYIDLRVYIHI